MLISKQATITPIDFPIHGFVLRIWALYRSTPVLIHRNDGADQGGEDVGQFIYLVHVIRSTYADMADEQTAGETRPCARLQFSLINWEGWT